MQIGLPKEVKVKENRVALTPSGVAALIQRGHTVIVEHNAGAGSGFLDDEYAKNGASIGTASQAWDTEMVVKVKEPVSTEYKFLRPDLVLFTYLHLAANWSLTQALLQSQTTGIAYETVQLSDHSLPLLIPMSEVAGRLSVQAGAFYLQKFVGGRGVLLGGVPGVEPGHVVVLGGGVVGTNAAKMAIGLGAQVTVLDVSHRRLAYLDDIFANRLTTMISNENTIRELLPRTDLVIGGVLIPGTKAPHLITRDMLCTMRAGSVIVDVAVDQGGCVETIHPTTYDEPIYTIDDIVHYGVANMPGAVPRTSTLALTNQTLPYVLALAEHGIAALRHHTPLLLGLNTYHGMITYQGIADAFNLSMVQPAQALN